MRRYYVAYKGVVYCDCLVLFSSVWSTVYSGVSEL